MALLNSEGLLLLRPSTNPLQAQHQQSAIILVSSSTLRAPARRLGIACSAGSSSSLLEQASNEVQFVHFVRRNSSPSSSSSSSSTAPYRRARTVRPQLVPDPDDAAKQEDDVRPRTRDPPQGFTKDELAESPGADALAFEYYNKAKIHPGFRPDTRLLRNLVRYLLRTRDWAAVPALAADFRTLGVLPDRAACARLVGACVRARKFRAAESLLAAIEEAAPQGKRQQQVAVAAYGAAMRGYNRLHMYRSAVEVHDRMVGAGVVPDEACFCAAMDAHRKLRNMDKVVALFQEFAGARNDAATGSGKNSTHGRKSAAAAEAADYVSRMYMILCDSLGRAKRPFEALRYFREMTDEKGIPPDPSSYGSLISSFATAKEVEIAEDLFKEARDRGLVKDPALFLNMVYMYVDTGKAHKTIQVVKEMRDLSIPISDCVLCAVVNGHVKNGGFRAAARAYEDLIALGCSPGQVTYASAINVYCRLGLSAKAESLFKEMLSRGYDRCVVAYSNIIAMYGRAERVRDATRLLAEMKARGCEPNVWVYNALIDMHGRRAGTGGDDVRQVGKLLKEMQRKKVEPDKITYTSVIAAYSKAREYGECVEYYKEFRDAGGRADRAMVAIMVGVFSKTSRVEELIQLLQDVKAEGVVIDERLYMSALNALRDAGLQLQIAWFRETFAYADPKSSTKTVMPMPAEAANPQQKPTSSSANHNRWTRFARSNR